MEAGPDLEETRNSATDFDTAQCRLEDARQNLEQGGLARPVVADDADHFPALDLEIDIAQRPELFDFVAFDDGATAQHVRAAAHEAAGGAHERFTQDRGVFDLVADDELLAEFLGADDDVGHAQIRSAKPRSVRRNV